MSRSKENVLEQYVHFIILGVAGLLAAGLLFRFVLISPNTEEFAGQTVTPSNIDSVIRDYSSRIETALETEPEQRGRYVSKASDFEAFMNNSIAGVELSYFAFPGEDSAAFESLREYELPQVPSPSNMYADKVRTVAHKPVVQLQIEDSYATAPTKVEDVDIVTVEATIDATTLYENFERTFAGRSIKAQWRDEALAKVIFAGVQLQRQELIAGTWSEWEIVPRTKIDKYSKAFQEVFQAQDPSSAEILMPQFIIPELWRNALQPPMYDIAQFDFRWYPPSLLGDYQREIANQLREQQRAEREAARTTPDRRTTRDRQPATQQTPGFGGGEMGMGGMGMPEMGAQTRTTTRTDRSRDTRTTTRDDAAARARQSRDFEREFQDKKLDEKTELSRLRGELTVWAHDDSVEPGKTYRYRLRYGVFNPVAGKGWYSEQYSDYNDQIVLWSDFTDVTSPFYIDLREYIFPTGVRESSVLVKIAKLKLGNWQTQEFRVNPGEFIGYEVEQEVKRATTTRYNRNVADAPSETEIVDYSTGAIFLNLKEVVDWELAGVITERAYPAMIYSKDGQITSIPTRERYWHSQLIEAQRMINSSSERIVEVSTDRSGTIRDRGGFMGGDGGMGMPGMDMGMPGMGMPGM